MPSPINKLSAFLRCEAGTYAVFFGLMMIPLAGAVGVAVDVVRMTHMKTDMQGIADAAALAGAARVKDTKQIKESTAVDFVIKSAINKSRQQLNPPVVLADAATGQVSVSLSAPFSPSLMKMFTKDMGYSISTRSVAIGVPGQSRACILALNQGMMTGFLMNGQADLKLKDCQVTSNASGPSSMVLNGSGTVEASCFTSSGSIMQNMMTIKTHGAGCPSNGKSTNQAVTTDPYASLAEPTQPPGPCIDVLVNGSDQLETLDPKKCYNNIDINGFRTKVNILPGNIYVKGRFVVNGSAEVKSVADGSTAAGSMLYFKEGSPVFNGQTKIDLKPQLTGTYKGMSVFMGRNGFMGMETQFTINGTSDSSLNGVIYAPKSRVVVNGLGSTSSPSCLELVASSVTLNGIMNATTQGCEQQFGMSGAKAVGGAIVRLVN